MRQFTGVAEAEPPANNLSGLQVEHNRQVMLFSTEAEVRKILHPSTGSGHITVTLPSLGLGLVPEHCELFQRVRCSRYLCFASSAPLLLLAGYGNGEARKPADASRFLLAPTQVQGKAADTVEGMLGMRFAQPSYIYCIFCLLGG